MMCLKLRSAGCSPRMQTRLSPLFFAGAPLLLCLIALTGTIALVAVPSQAQQKRNSQRRPILVDFRYRAPLECMDDKQAFSLLHRRSRRVMRADSGGSVQQLNMAVVADSAGYRGVLRVKRLGQAEERRSMTGESCDEVVEALALTAALSIDPNATLTLGPSSPESEARSDDGSPGRTVGSSDREGGISSSTSLPRVTLGASLSSQKLMNQVMHVGGGAVLSISGDGQKVVLPAEARLSLHVLTEATTPRESSIFTSFILSRFAYCPLRFGHDSSVMLCPVSQVGAVMAQSRGFEGDSQVTRFLMTVGLEGWLRTRISRRWELWLSPALTVPLTRRHFAVQPGPEVLSATVDVAWGVSAGIGWSF